MIIKIGIIGSGGMAKERAKVFAQMEHVLVAGVFSHTAKKAQEIAMPCGTQVFSDYEQLLLAVDAVVICVPNNLHLQFVMKALRAGKHVLVEYPPATGREEITWLKATALAHNSVLMVGNTIIHESWFRYINQNRKRFGAIVSAASRVALYDETSSRKWFMDKAQLGPVFSSLHYHHIEFYKHFLGQVEWVLGCEESIVDAASEQYTSLIGGTLILGYGMRKTSCIQWYLGTSGNGLSRSMCINGTKGTLSFLAMETGKTHVVWGQGDEVEILEEDWGIAGSCKDFIMAIDGELDYRTRLNDDLYTFQIGLAGTDSVRAGSIVYLNREEHL